MSAKRMCWLKLTRFAQIIFFIAFLQGCDPDEPEILEIKRVPSPDARIDLVITTLTVDATVSTVYQVYLAKHGEQPNEHDLILKIDKTLAPGGSWLAPDLISVKCADARIWHFKNFWSARLPESNSVTNVNVVLACGAHSLHRADRSPSSD